MIDLTFNSLYALDLHDDVFCNYDLTLYQFLDKDPVRAFYLGMYMKQWFQELGQERQYLYSKQFLIITPTLRQLTACAILYG